MPYLYLTCPACRSKFNARDTLPFAFCPQCSHRVETREYTEDEIRQMFIRSAVKCNRNCEKTGFKCRCGCVLETYRE